MTMRQYVSDHHPIVLAADGLRLLSALASPLLAIQSFRLIVAQDYLTAPLHRQLWHAFPSTVSIAYSAMLVIGVTTCMEFALLAFRNLLSIALTRLGAERKAKSEILGLPPYPFNRESFALVLG